MRRWAQKIWVDLHQFYAIAPWRNLTIRAVFGTTVANAAILGINVLTGIITARALAPVGRGELAAVVMWPQFLSFALAFGLPSSLIYHLQGRRHEVPLLVGTAISIGTLASILGAIAGAIFVPYALNAYSQESILIAQLCMIFSLPGVLLTLLNAVLLQQGQVARYNYIRLIAPLTTLLLLLGVLAIDRKLTVGAAALAYLVPVVPLALWAVLITRQAVGLRLLWNRAAAGTLLGYGLRYYGAEVAGTLATQVDRIVVVLILTPQAVGLYVVALSFSRVFQIIPVAVTTILLPKVAGRSPSEVVRIIFKVATVALMLSLLMALPVLLFGSTLLSIFFGPDFAVAGMAFSVLVAEALASGCGLVLSQAFLAVGRPGRMSLYQMIGLAAMVPLLFWWGPIYGIFGIALANLASTLFGLLFIVLGVYRLRLLAPAP